jgi:hypothetical protein
MNVPSTSPPQGASRASLVYAGKNKVRYFLNTPRTGREGKQMVLSRPIPSQGMQTETVIYNCFSNTFLEQAVLAFPMSPVMEWLVPVACGTMYV